MKTCGNMILRQSWTIEMPKQEKGTYKAVIEVNSKHQEMKMGRG